MSSKQRPLVQFLLLQKKMYIVGKDIILLVPKRVRLVVADIERSPCY